MKKAQNKILSFYNLLIIGLLSILGFSASCNKDNKVEYGTPTASFMINGKIVDKDSNTPIKDIKVLISRDSTYSDAQGMYQLIDHMGFPGDAEYSIQFIDVDGPQNGEYHDLDTIVNFTDPQFEEGSGWYSGQATQEFNVELKSK